MTRWFWIRHGPTHQKTLTGWRDVPADLSDTAQIARLHADLPKDAVVVSSDLSRASATADCLSDGRERHPDMFGLREFHFGDWDGRHFKDVAATDPELSRSYWENPGDVTPPGGESWNASARRVDAAVAELGARHKGRAIILVAHFGVILTRLQRAQGSTARAVLAQKIDPLSVTELHQNSDGWEVVRVNHTL